MTPGFTWELLSKGQAHELQAFTCTEEAPRVPGARRPLPHPRPWERVAQSHLRGARVNMKAEDTLHVGRDSSGVVCAAALVRYAVSTDTLVAFIEALGIRLERRHQGGALADELLSTIEAVASREASTRACSELLVVGMIHVENLASQRACLRAGLEPDIEIVASYQRWGKRIAVDPSGARGGAHRA